jgi:osmoprotectant transport system substrate-binding protein
VRERRVGLAVAALLVAAVAACAGPAQEPAPRADGVVVASFDFAESALLAEVYAQALEQAGVPVTREPRLGPRELVLPALLQGRVDVVPEYLGTALAAVDPPAPGEDRPGDVDEAHRRLSEALAPNGLRALAPAAAENRNGLVVTRQTARERAVRTTSDLVPVSRELVLVGPSECLEREYCLPGLQRVYGLRFRDVVLYDGEEQRITALEQGVADVAVVFTTDGALAERDLVLLEDDRSLQPPENVVPVVREEVVERFGERVVTALEQVSARLDTAALTFLNWRVREGGDVGAEATGWLQRQGLVPR